MPIHQFLFYMICYVRSESSVFWNNQKKAERINADRDIFFLFFWALSYAQGGWGAICMHDFGIGKASVFNV